MPEEQPSYVDEHHQRISEFAGDYLDEDEREEFVNGLMERRGYQRGTHWLPPEDDDGGQGGRKPVIPKRATGGGQGGQQRRGAYFKR